VPRGIGVEREGGEGVKPYYEHAGITIYHGDCREVLPGLEADACVTDPPYGMGLDTDYTNIDSRRTGLGINHAPVFSDDTPFDPANLLRFRSVVIFGANHFASKLPDNGAWIVFNKRGEGAPSAICFGDAELAWTNKNQDSVRMYSKVWHGAPRWQSEPVCHPTQKPISLMVWAIQNYTNEGESVIDPYMGSGPVLIAAKDLGRRAIGIEIEEKYCEIAAKRLSQEVLEFV
jgi:site-specific DNA-methyltransferase (adenine-specific)